MEPEQLEALLVKHFPKDATTWSQATDEVRELCREARIFAGVGEEGAVDFTTIKTPGEWNTKGIDGIVHFFRCMYWDQEGAFLKRAKELFPFIFEDK